MSFLRVVAYNKMNLVSRVHKTSTDCRRKHNVSVKKKNKARNKSIQRVFSYLLIYYHSHFGKHLYYIISWLLLLMLLLLVILCQMGEHKDSSSSRRRIKMREYKYLYFLKRVIVHTLRYPRVSYILSTVGPRTWAIFAIITTGCYGQTMST